MKVTALSLSRQSYLSDNLKAFCSAFYRATATQLCYRGLGSRNFVRLSHACFVTEKQCTADILIPHERAITLVFWHQQWLVGDASFPLKFARPEVDEAKANCHEAETKIVLIFLSQMLHYGHIFSKNRNFRSILDGTSKNFGSKRALTCKLC